MYTFTHQNSDGTISQTSKPNYKQALSFEQCLKRAQLMYQVHYDYGGDNLPDHSKTPESDYLDCLDGYKEKPVISWIDQIEAMRAETAQVNFIENSCCKV